MEILLAVMLADPKDVQSYLIGVLDFCDELTDAVRRTYCAGFLEVGRRETINTNLHIPHAPNGKSDQLTPAW